MTNGLIFATELPYCSTKLLRPKQTSSIPQMLRDGMIWSSTSTPVKLAGPPKAIANGALHGSVVDSDEHVVFLRKVEFASAPARATLHLFAFTRYRLYINGEYAGRGPSRFQNQRPEYDTREISSLLKKGSNSIAVLVHRDAPTGRIMSHAPGFAAVRVGQVVRRRRPTVTWRIKRFRVPNQEAPLTDSADRTPAKTTS